MHFIHLSAYNSLINIIIHDKIHKDFRTSLNTQKQNMFCSPVIQTSSSRKQKCGICREYGHNRIRCPNKAPAEPNVVECQIDLESEEVKREIQHYIQRMEVDGANICHNNQQIQEKLVRDQQFDDWKKFDEKQRNEHDDDIKKYLTIPQEPYYGMWFSNQEECWDDMLYSLMSRHEKGLPKPNHFLITAEMGAGKTDMTDCLAYKLSTIMPTLPGYSGDHFNLRHRDHMFLISPYSSKDYVPDMKRSLKFIPSENIYHRNDVEKDRKFQNRIKAEPHLLHNAVIFIDEARLVLQKGMTIDKLWQMLGLNVQIIKKHNIMFCYIDATPQDISLAFDPVMSTDVDSLRMRHGETYYGTERILMEDGIIRFSDVSKIANTDIHYQNGRENLVNLIRNVDGNHVFRIKNQKDREHFISLLRIASIDYYVDTGLKSHKDYHWFDEEISFGDAIRKNHGKPTVFILIDKYTCSKRFRFDPNIKTIYDSRSDDKSDNSSTQGLIGRFMGYYEPDELQNLSIDIYGCKEHFERYLAYLNTGVIDPEYVSANFNAKLKKLSKETHLDRTLRIIPAVTSFRNSINDDYVNYGIVYSGNKSGQWYREHRILTPEVMDITHPPSIPINVNVCGKELISTGEEYESIEELNARMKELTKKDYDFRDSRNKKHGYSVHITIDYLRTLGQTRASSNLPESLEKFSKGKNKTFTHRIHVWKDQEGHDRYYLRWMAKKEHFLN